MAVEPSPSRARTVRWTLRLTTCVILLLAVAVYTFTDDALLAEACYQGALFGASVYAWVGAAHAPRDRRRAPVLIAIGVTLTAAGDAVWALLYHLDALTPLSLADPFWLLSYVALLAGLWALLDHAANAREDLSFLIDGLTIVAVSLLVFWSFSIDSIAADATIPPLHRLVEATYPVADALMLAVVLRLLTDRRSRRLVSWPIALGVCLWLGSDVGYLLGVSDPTVLTLMDAGWMVAPALIATAAWRHEFRRPEIAPTLERSHWVAQLLVAVVPLLVPPALEVQAHVRTGEGDPVQLMVGTAVLTSLAFARKAHLLRSQRRVQRELELARDAALDASRAKSMFLANMSHEIRTPLTTVLAATELLEDTDLDPVQTRLLTRMQHSGAHLKALVEEVLDFSRIEAGRLELQPVAFDLHEVVADLAETYAARAAAQGVAFDWTLDHRVPRRVVGDVTRVVQVLTNLLDNAVKFTHEGSVTIDVRRGTGPEVLFTVSDTGIGIAEEHLDRIFDTFTQVDGSETRRYGGNGLGLAICRQLTGLLGGTVTASRRAGAGSRFEVRIPLAAIGPADPVPSAAPCASAAPVPTSTP